ncbi:TIM barrel protein [Cohnella sp. CFH 77786]|uniref:sugar phosphate isomerase/epimerase family protein n=1 Tax=Cohnella sp. CFH 77786 TaxID=2662265 RepID=UPI001C6098C3|nr:sugar phosphate isomerase/epimerase [Cohnella sp. CFH 77786]MBW5447549.1 TIM barrel protein [Cohnella sp. CFH 77786]
MLHKFAAQLYTLRNELKKDFYDTLRTLSKMGWKAVQIDGLHGYPAAEIAAVLKETGLSAAGMHVGLNRMTRELDAVLEEARLFGTPYFFNHYLEGELQNEAGYRSAKRQLLEVSDKVKPLGFQVGYHHHEFEFETEVDGMPALDFVLQPEDGRALVPEIDTYWVKFAGRDPLEYLSKFPNRIPILHLKDMAGDGSKAFTELGNGVIDFAPILRWGEANGVQWYCVEQDDCPGSPFVSLETSLNHLRTITGK